MRWKVRECHCQSNHAIRFLSNLFLESHIEDYALFTSPFATIISRWRKATWIPNIHRRKEGFVVFPSVFFLFGSNITCWRTNLKCKGEKSATAKPYCLHRTCPVCARFAPYSLAQGRSVQFHNIYRISKSYHCLTKSTFLHPISLFTEGHMTILC